MPRAVSGIKVVALDDEKTSAGVGARVDDCIRPTRVAPHPIPPNVQARVMETSPPIPGFVVCSGSDLFSLFYLRWMDVRCSGGIECMSMVQKCSKATDRWRMVRWRGEACRNTARRTLPSPNRYRRRLPVDGQATTCNTIATNEVELKIIMHGAGVY